MEKERWNITLSDGTALNGLRLNGNNFISTQEITTSLFAGNLSKVVMEHDGMTEEYTDMELVQISKMGEEWWFILRKIPAEELARAALLAQINSLKSANDDMILMMADLIGG